MKFQLQLGPRPLNLAAEDFRLLQYVQVALYILNWYFRGHNTAETALMLACRRIYKLEVW